MLQTLKLNNKKRKKSSFYDEKSLVGLTPGVKLLTVDNKNDVGIKFQISFWF